MYPLTPGANLSAAGGFHNVNEGSGQGTATAASLLQVPGMQGQQSQPESLAERMQGLNWMQNPAALVGTAGFNMMAPYLGQLGMGGAGVGQQAVNLLGSGLPGSGNGSDGNILSKVSATSARKLSQPVPQRRGASISDIPRDAGGFRPGEISPSNTPPLGTTGVKKPQFPVAPDAAGKWKSMSDQPPPQIMMTPYGFQSQPVMTGTTTALSGGHMIPTPGHPGHMMSMGFPSAAVVGGSPPGAPPHLSKGGRAEGVLGGGSPRMPHDNKVKLRIHQVRNDDFKMQVKPDRRRKKWRGKDKDIVLSSKAELAESAVRRMGIFNEATAPALNRDTIPIPALPASLGVEPRPTKRRPTPPTAERHGKIEHPSTTAGGSGGGNGDSNYALNMLADMSSKQSKEGRLQPPPLREEGVHSSKAVPLISTTLAPTSSGVASAIPHSRMRSPVSLAARSLLMLGEDLNITDKSGGVGRGESKAADVENTAATSLLQLSGAVTSKGADTAVSNYPTADSAVTSGRNQLERPPPNAQTRSTRSASFSAAEAMIMMGTGSDEKEAVAAAPKDTPPTQYPPGTTAETRKNKPSRLSIDSEATDTDSEATLTPETPRLMKRQSPFLVADPGEMHGVAALKEPSERREGMEMAESRAVSRPGSSSSVVVSGSLASGPTTSQHGAVSLPGTNLTSVLAPGSNLSGTSQSVSNVGKRLMVRVQQESSKTGSLVEAEQKGSTLTGPEQGGCGGVVSVPPSEEPSLKVAFPLGDYRVGGNPMEGGNPSEEGGRDDRSHRSTSLETGQASLVQSPGGVGDSTPHLSDPDVPPAAKRPKFISTFGPASDDTDASAGSHSMVPLTRDETDSHSTMSRDGSSEPHSQSMAREESAAKADSHSIVPVNRDDGDKADSHPVVPLSGREGDKFDSHAMESLDQEDRDCPIPSAMMMEETSPSVEVLESGAAPINPNTGDVARSVAVTECLQPVPESGNSERKDVSAVDTADIDSRTVNPDAASVLPEEVSHDKSPLLQSSMSVAAQETERQLDGKSGPMGAPGSSSSVVSDGGNTSSPRKIKVSKKSRDALGSKTKSSNIKRVIKIKRAKSPKLAKTLPDTAASPCSDGTTEKPTLSSWAAFADAAMEDNERSPSISKSDAVKSPPTEIAMETTPVDSTEKDGRDIRDAGGEDSPIASRQPPSKEDSSPPGKASASALSSVVEPVKVALSSSDVTPPPVDTHVLPQNRLKVSRPEGFSAHRHHHYHHKRPSKPEDRLFGRPERPEDKLSGKRPSTKAPQEHKGRDLTETGMLSASKEDKKDMEGRTVRESRKEVEGGAVRESRKEVEGGAVKESRKEVEGGTVRESRKEVEGGAVKVKKHKSSRKVSPHGTASFEKERFRGEIEKPKHLLSSRNYSDSDDSAALAPHSMDSQSWDSAREFEARPHPLFPPQSSQEQPRVSPSQQQTHSPFSVTAKEHESEFSPLSDDDFMKVTSSSRHPIAKESRPVKWSEDEDWKQKSHKRHQSGVDDSSLPSPASSLGSSGSKKHHRRRHHHHHERSSASTPSGDPSHYPPPALPPKHDHHSSDKSSLSRGPTPERSKRHHHHHHRSSGGDRHHHTHEGGRGRNPSHHPTASSSSKGELKRSYESISDDDPFKDGDDDHLNRRSLHDRLKTSSSRKRRRSSSADSAEGSGDPLPVSAESRGGHSGGYPSKHKKAKKHSKEHKERWKEGGGSSKHKHSHK